MAEHELTVGLVISRHMPSSVWGEPLWVADQALDGLPAAEPWSVLAGNREKTTYFAGAYPIHLHSASTGYYRDNLSSERPSIWVVMRPSGAEPPCEIVLVTVDPTEGEGATETGTNVVGVIDMTPSVAAGVAGFVAQHHVERVFEKRQRDKTLPGDRRGSGGRR